MKQTLTREIPTELAHSNANPIELVRLANEVWGSAVARKLWAEMGLPLPVAGAPVGARTSAAMSVVRRFCDERIIHDHGVMIGADKLHSELCCWLESQALEIINATILGRCLRQLGFVRVKSDRIFYRGITLRTSPLAEKDTDTGPNPPVQQETIP